MPTQPWPRPHSATQPGWLLLGAALLTQPLLAQSKLAGYVTEQNSGKKPVAEVMVHSFGANPIASSNSGQFILTYQNFAAGKDVVVRAEKDGWELVNEKEMNTKIPADPDKNPLKIVVCPVGTLAKAKSKYYNTFEANLLAELTKQKALNRGNQKELARLEEEFQKMQVKLNEYADQYSRTNLDDASEKQIKAIELFKAGKYAEFIALQESIVTKETLRRAHRNKGTGQALIANADSTITAYINSHKEIVKAQRLQFNFKGVEETYEKIVLADTTNFDNASEFAYFLQEQNQHDKAIGWYKKALTLAKTELDVARTQNDLGVLYKAKNDYVSALTAYQTALAIYERLAKANPATYESDVAVTQNNLGNLYQARNDYGSALRALQAALAIFERLAKTNPARYEPEVAATQNNLGNLYQAKEDYGSALSALQAALAIFERLAKTNPARYEPLVAHTQNNLGSLYKAKNDYISALRAYQTALAIRERLAKANPAAYDPLVAHTQNNLGHLYQKKNDYVSALRAYQTALSIRERLAKTNPAAYEPDVAATQNSLGNLYEAQNEYVAALSAYQTALEVYERLAKTNPDGFEVEFCRSVVLLALLQQTDYQPERQSRLDQYLAIAKQLLPKYKEVLLAQSLLEGVEQLQIYFAHIEVISRIQTLRKQVEEEKEYTKKIALQRQVVEHYQSLVGKGCTTLLADWAGGLGSLAWYQLFNRQFAQAEQSIREALCPSRYPKPEGYDQQVEWVNTNLALALLFQGQYAQAEAIYMRMKDKPYNRATYRTAFLADLTELEQAGITHPDVAKIRALLAH